MNISRLLLFAALPVLMSFPATLAHAENLERALASAVELDSVSSYQADARFHQLRRSARDARVSYIHGLLLIDRQRYQDAVQPIEEAVALNPGNLDAWKVRIWLAVMTENHEGALDYMEALTNKMPGSHQGDEHIERQCHAYSNFMGQLFGYLAAPAGDNTAVHRLSDAEARIVDKLTDSRLAAFDRGREQVLAVYNARYSELQQMGNSAGQRQQAYDQARLAELRAERDRTEAELVKVEDRRERVRQLASEERNVIAATRDESIAGSAEAGRTRYRDTEEFGPYYRQPPNAKKGDPWVLDHLYDRNRNLRSGYAASSLAARDRGLDDRHYADVNRRQDDDDQRLDELKYDLETRLRRIAQDEKNLILRPKTGFTPIMRSKALKAKALTTYVGVPVDPRHEVREVLATLQ